MLWADDTGQKPIVEVNVDLIQALISFLDREYGQKRSAGGLFKLITNDGKQDVMLMATPLLNQRLANILAQRAQAGLDDA
jgi:hypothetical protein